MDDFMNYKELALFQDMKECEVTLLRQVYPQL